VEVLAVEERLVIVDAVDRESLVRAAIRVHGALAARTLVIVEAVAALPAHHDRGAARIEELEAGGALEVRQPERGAADEAGVPADGAGVCRAVGTAWVADHEVVGAEVHHLRPEAEEGGAGR